MRILFPAKTEGLKMKLLFGEADGGFVLVSSLCLIKTVGPIEQ